ncbi:MAG: hypothetical protein JWN59_1024 [Sphingomonas bacterium]|nr:hypothetical protein [Sphingomonas bacterium]
MALSVTICLCTFRRNSIAATLASIGRQQAVGPEALPVIVVDNDEDSRGRERIEAAAAVAGVELLYVHAPARNISNARNAALDSVETRWAAFIDDDEEAAQDWLAELMAGRAAAEAVIGRSHALYGPDLPSWAADCDFHSNRIAGRADNAYTSNALLDMVFVNAHHLRFRLDLGQTGGEDTMFFRALAEAGGRIAYCPQSVVFEPVPAQRATMRWVLRRRFRAGQTHGLVLQEHDCRGFDRLAFSAGLKLTAAAVMAVATIPGTVASRRWAARAALHAGALAYRVRPSILREYGGT